MRGLERRLGASQDSHRSPPDAARTLPKTRPGRLQTRIKRGKTPEPVGTRSSREYAPNTLPKINVASLPEILIELSWLSHYPSSVTLSILTLLVPFFRPAPTYSDQGSLGLQAITYVKFQLLCFVVYNSWKYIKLNMHRRGSMSGHDPVVDALDTVSDRV